MDLSIRLSMPDAAASEKKDCNTVEDAVRDALDLIDTSKNSDVEWIMILGLHDELTKMRPTPRITNLIKMIEPVMHKYGYYNDRGPR